MFACNMVRSRPKNEKKKKQEPSKVREIYKELPHAPPTTGSNPSSVTSLSPSDPAPDPRHRHHRLRGERRPPAISGMHLHRDLPGDSLPTCPIVCDSRCVMRPCPRQMTLNVSKYTRSFPHVPRITKSNPTSATSPDPSDPAPDTLHRHHRLQGNRRPLAAFVMHLHRIFPRHGLAATTPCDG
jgi:hypothetical protein